MINIEEALEIVESILEQGRLNKVQETVFRQSWEGASYGEITRISGYDTGTLKILVAIYGSHFQKRLGVKLLKIIFRQF